MSPAPGRKSVAALKTRQTGANLRQDAGRGHLPDTGNDFQPLPQLLVRDQLFLQADQHLSQLPFQLPDAPKKQAELKAVMSREEAPDGAAQFLGLLSARPGSTSLQVRQVRYPILVGQALQDQSTRGPEDVCKDWQQV